jgi:hypothetical protein
MKTVFTALFGGILSRLHAIYYGQCRIPRTARRMLRTNGYFPPE